MKDIDWNSVGVAILFFVFGGAAVWHGLKYSYERAYSSNPKIYERCLAAERALSFFGMSDGSGIRGIVYNIRKDNIEINDLRLAAYGRSYYKSVDAGGFGNPLYSIVKRHNSTSCMNLHKQESIDIPFVLWGYYAGYLFW